MRMLHIVRFNFIEGNNNERIPVEGLTTETVLDTARKYDIDIEAACNGELACSTCHLICNSEAFNSFPKPSDEEIDMLDLIPDHIRTNM
jgi:ferredoxin